MERVDLLRRLGEAPALRRLPVADLGRLADGGGLREFSPGDVLLQEGGRAGEVFLLLEGRVAIFKRAGGSAERKIATRVSTDWIGESGAFDDSPSSASVVAEGPVRALAIPRETFLEVVSRDVEPLLDLVRSVTARLRESDDELIQALSRQVRTLESQNLELSTENRRLHSALDDRHGFESFVGTSPAVRSIRDLARRAAENDLPVVIVGETGTGKELLARAIHASGQRGKRPFVAVNCALLTAPLLESELFGHARGAFTGATQAKRGLVEEADGGTLLLDEVTDIPLPLQGALLRFLELGEFRRLGETAIRRAIVRVIAATQTSLDEAARAGAFRLDLLYRLDVIQMRIPALRERQEDLPLLIDHFLRRIASRRELQPLQLDPEALELLLRYDFPGNVRELENEIERLYALETPTSSVGTDALSPRIARTGGVSSQSYGDAIREFKSRTIERALRECAGNKTRAAARLGVHRANLVRMIRDLGIKEPPARGNASPSG
jgi:DNA-binding NtrC family response regulator